MKLVTPVSLAASALLASVVSAPALVAGAQEAWSPLVEPLDAVVQADVVPREPFIEDWWVYATYGVFPQAPLQSFAVGVYYSDYNYSGGQFLDSTYCDVLVDGATVTHDGEAFHFDFAPGSRGYAQSQNVLRCSWYAHEPASAPEMSWFSLDAADARDADGNAVDTQICMTAFETNPDPNVPWVRLCGDADSNGRVGAPDALLALRQSTGAGACGTVCDVDRSGDTSAADALRILRTAVGIEQPLLCAAECIG